MPELTDPTDGGRLRYPAYTDRTTNAPVEYAAGYNHSFIPPIPCTCSPACQARCVGECGCAVCRQAFSEYADTRGWYGPKGNPLEPPLERQFEEYRRALGPQKRP